jgi:hypothetical protein
MQMPHSERERHMYALATELLFEVKKQGARFTLTWEADVSAPVRHENLTLDEAEEVLSTGKLRGAHGG